MNLFCLFIAQKKIYQKSHNNNISIIKGITPNMGIEVIHS